MSQLTIDVDAEAVFLDGTWYTREDLARRIRAMLDAADFNVAAPSVALQELTQTLHGVRTLAFRCTPELADALTDLGARLGQSVSSLVREAVTQFITVAAPQAPSDSPVSVQTPSSQGAAASPAPAGPGASQDDLPRVHVEEQPVVIAGPGALRAAGVPHEGPGEPRRTQAPPFGELAGERGWFNE
jgi:hypothetical protein